MGLGNNELDKVVEIAGYLYDPVQDIFLSRIDPWQRTMGYCRLYDEAAAPLGMIIDSEPIYFDYNNKKWMIGIWKGQYDMVTGGELGIYTGVLDIDIPSIFKGTFFKAAEESEYLDMSFTLIKNGTPLFTRSGRHWWLTGFKLGEFSNPSELAMGIHIRFNDPAMLEAFVKGLLKAGYKQNELEVTRNSISFLFAKPRTRQPLTRTSTTDKMIQKKNKLLCEMYQEVTGHYETVQEKLDAIELSSPELYSRIFALGKNKKHYEIVVLTIMIGAAYLAYVAKKRERINLLD
jgi:hypothetical protein